MANPLINRQRVRQLALDTFNSKIDPSLRGHYGKDRVSPEWLDTMEAKFRSLVVQEVSAMPSGGGKTIR